MLLDELGEVLDGAVAVVLDRRALGARGEELERREAGHILWDVVGGGVDLGDRDRVGGVQGGEFFVFGGEAVEREGSVSVCVCGCFIGVTGGGGRWKIGKGEKGLRFAVAAPRGVVLDEDVLGLIHDDVVVVVRDDNDDRALLLLGDGLALDARLDLAVDEVLDKFGDQLLSKLLVLWEEREFLVLPDLLDGEGGEFVGRQVEIACVGAVGFGVDCGEVDLASVFLGDRLELEGEGVTLLRGLCEDVG